MVGREFEEEEVSKALKECDGDKAPSPDGFDFSFIKAGWEFLKEGCYRYAILVS